MNTIANEALSFFDDGKAFPPGFRFHPTDEELILYHLKGKMCNRRFKFDVIAETDVYKWDPEEFAGLSKLKTGDRQWFFFTPRDRKYPNGARSNRTTRRGYWKLTGKDRTIICSSRSVGVKKTLIYYIGRSPSGERTDWVMHEYTLTEDEVKRCQSITDYYALYKVFKKSGPGPKNGEQYGAPFREEDWEDEEVDANNCLEPVNNVKEVDLAPNNAEMQILLDDFDEFMNKIENDPVHVQSVGVEPNGGFSLGDLVGEEEAHLTEQSLVLQPSWQNYNGEGSFDITQSNILCFNNEAPEVTSTVTNHLPESNLAEGDLEEFIEMDDLFCSDFTGQHELENSQFNEFVDGLEEFDLYKDLYNCLDNSEEQDQELIYHQDTNNMNQTYNFKDEQSNFQLDGPNTNYLPLLHDQSCNDYTYGDALQFHTTALATPGVINDSNCSKHLETGANENNCWKQDEDGKDSRISSFLWSFVESIPTTPASAAENALIVNRAFERMSSFSKLQLFNDVSSSASGSGSINAGNKHRRVVLFCFSVVVMLCAVLWMMMIGTNST